MKRIGWIVFAVCALGVGFYPALYLIIDMSGGLLASKSRETLEQLAWNIAFYTHIAGGGIALLSGWSQFATGRRPRMFRFHRVTGTVYASACLLSGVAAFYLALCASTGLAASIGFGSLSVFWLGSTYLAYTTARKREISRHRIWMTRSFALTFAAVMLRVYLPLAQIAGISFEVSYPIISFLCWVPNLIVAEIIIRNLGISRSTDSAEVLEH